VTEWPRFWTGYAPNFSGFPGGFRLLMTFCFFLPFASFLGGDPYRGAHCPQSSLPFTIRVPDTEQLYFTKRKKTR